MTSVLVSYGNIDLRWKVPVKKNTGTKVVGADAGLVTTLWLYDKKDGEFSTDSLTDNHGHTQQSIVEKIARKKRGSAAYTKAVEHQQNFINWTINQLDFSDMKTLRLENNKGIKDGARVSPKLRAWSWSKIHNSLAMKCKEKDVLLSLQAPEFKSQRCYCCGFVHKTNRKTRDDFECKNCGHKDNADLNSAKNQALDLFPINRSLVAGRNKTTGFFWDLDKLDFPGQESVGNTTNRVPVTKKTD